MEWRKEGIPFYIKFHGLLVFLWMLFLFIYRLCFYAMYSYRIEETPILIVLKAFLIGFRFDFTVTAYFVGPFLLLSCLHFPNKWAFFRWIWRTIPVACLVILTILLGADLLYYENANKHIGYEAYAYLGPELITMMKAAFAQGPFLFILAVLALTSLILVINKIQKKYPYWHIEKKPSRLVLQGFVVLLLVFLAARGGWQNSPIRTGDAIISHEAVVNDLAVNAAFTTVTDMKVTNITGHHKMNIKQAVQMIREEISYPGATFISEKYPLLRKLEAKEESQKPNIIVIVLEGWTGRFIKPITNGLVARKEVTPYFNALIPQGLFFTRFFAAGGRTTNGLMALMSGLPDRPGLTAVRTQQILNRFSGLGNILKQKGYLRFFFTGTDLSFNNKGSIMKHWGFNRLSGKKKMMARNKYTAGPWSFHDRDIFDSMHAELSKLPPDQPFVSVIHTGTTHYPYQVPDQKYAIFDDNTRDSAYLNVLHYADWALADYLKEAKKSTYFANTYFFIVSDHSHHRYLNYYEDRNIPFLLYAPGKIQAGIRREITSQLDILPTILGVLGEETYFTGMGRDLYAKKASSAYFAYGDLFGWIEKDIFYFQKINAVGKGESFTVGPPFEDTKRCKKNLQDCQMHYLKAKAFLNASYHILNTNRIFPKFDELKSIQ
ncbi:MAG: sulfatase-like hydrolase/transferase [Spirochaetota bacterium]